MPYRNPNNCKYLCTVFSGILVLLISLITIPSFVYPYFNALTFEETQCYINKIDYPYDLPTVYDYNNWAKCKCGRRCQSYSPCINLYTNISTLFIKGSYPDANLECTIHEKECTNCEDIRIINDYLQNSQNIYESYINQTTKCYIDSNGVIYLSLATDFDLMLASLIFIGLFFLCCIINVFVVIYNDNYKKKINNNNLSSTKESVKMNPVYNV
jgi:hypothetical protein